MSGLRRLRVTELHPNLLCILCGGYYVDATTIVECLHSFCKTCIVRYLESSKFCPICDVQVHKTKPLLSIRLDKTLQDIVYKLVPGLYQNEMCKRREFYSGHPETPPATPEDGGSDLGRWYILPDDPVSLALHPAPSSLTNRCYNTHLMPATSLNTCFNINPQTVRGDELTNQVNKNSFGHVRYLQCPAGVSVAQLKRLLRAKFGVGPSHPMALLTSSSDDPLHDTLTLVDVAYITSWQRTEPLQLFYRIYERASKKIKLDPESFSSEPLSSSEEMPKLEPSVGGDITSTMYGSSDSTSSMSDYSCAPLLQAVGALDSDSPVKNESSVEMPVSESIKIEEKPCETPKLKETGEKNLSTANSIETFVSTFVEPCTKDSQAVVKHEPHSELTQGNVCDSIMKTESAVSGSSVVDTIVTYSGAYTTPSNGVSVGVAFMPGELGYISPAGVPCAIISNAGCVPVTGNCIPNNTNIPVLCNTDVHRHTEGDGDVGVVNKWNSTGPVEKAHVKRENSQVPADVSSRREGVRVSEEDEGKEVQLKISESGVMSVCGRDTTVEGVLNSIESEACELLSKIESGSLCEEFLPKPVEKHAEKNAFEAGNCAKKSRTKDRSGEVVRSKGDTKSNKDQHCQKGEKLKSSNMSNISILNQKSESANVREMKGVTPKVNSNDERHLDNTCNDKTMADSKEKTMDKNSDMKKWGDLQNSKELKDDNTKDSRLSHIPASLTAASMANLNKPHLKAGTSKISQGEENKNKEQKPNNGLNSKKEGKQELTAKSLSGSGCRKSSQSYGYKTLKTPPKSWNPTISREQLALVAGKSSLSKGNKEPPRTNKFFKARNAPRFLGNPSAGVKPMYSHVVDNNGSQKRASVLKLDPKTLGPISVPVSNDLISPTSVSRSTSSASSVQSTAPATTQTASSTLRLLPSQTVDQRCPSNVQTDPVVVEPHAAVSKVKDTLIATTKAAPTLSTSLTSGVKESTNSSSKVISNANTSQDKNYPHKNTKSARSSSNNSSTTNRNLKLPSVQTSGSSKLEIKQDNKTNGGTVGLVGNSMASLVANSPLMNQLKLAVSTAMSTGIAQVKAETVSSLTAPNTNLQPQQHLTLGSPAVGVSIIPSCGVSFPGAIGTLPLPYYTNPSLAYPAYPYLYQGAETIGLIPPHHSASFIPTFPACLPPRSPLSPRNIGGAKMMPELPLQSSLLPMVPLVSQVPAQTMSPRPMTPPSPRTPTSTQSPRPYPAQSPRQYSTNQSSRPLTPQSPKSIPSVQSTRPQTQSPKLHPNLQPTVSQSHRLNNTGLLVTQPQCLTVSGQPEKFQLSTQQMPSMASSFLDSSDILNSNSVSLQNSSYKQNACVQTSVSHTLLTPKSVCNSPNSLKPPVPQSPRSIISNQPGVCLMQVVPSTTSQSSISHTPQSPKPNRPHTPQSPKCLNSTQCATLQTHVNNVSQANSPQSRHHGISSQQPELRIASNNKTKAKNVEANSRKVVDNATSGQLGGISNSFPSSVVSSSFPVSQVSSSFSTSGLNTPINSASGNKVYIPHGTNVSVSSSFPTLYPDSIVNSLPLPLANTLVTPEVSAAAMSFSLCNSSSALPISLSNVSSSLPVVSYNNSAVSLPTCPVTLPQAFYPGSTALSINLPPNSLQSVSQPLTSTQTLQSSYISVTAGNTPKSNASVVSVSTNNSGVGSVPCRSAAVLTMSTESTAYAPIPSSSSSCVLPIPTSSVAAVTDPSFTSVTVTMPMTVTALVPKSPAVTIVKGTSCSTSSTTVPLICTASSPLVGIPYVPLSSTLSMSAPVSNTVTTSVSLSSITSAPIPLSGIGSISGLESSPTNTTVPLSSTVSTAAPQTSAVSRTVPQSTTLSTVVSQISTASTTVCQSTSSTTVAHSNTTCTSVPQISSASTTICQSSTASITTLSQTSAANSIVPQSSTAGIAVSLSSTANTSVPVSSTVSMTVPQNSAAGMTVSPTCTVVLTAPSRSTGVSLSSSSGNSLPACKKDVKTVSANRKASTTVPLSSNLGTTIALGSTTSTSTPVVSTAGTAVSSSSTVVTSIPISNTAGISIPLSSTVVVARSQSSGCFALCGAAGGNSVLSAKERGGSVPQSSACTPVCDVTHVIDAKQQCAEPSVSSSSGPRPCLKS
ncbi:hypothetical protein OTU49_017294 [Cherax quadricarinatus]|uniref:RING-type domain-containing protein n=1 Tax=Cherax quadricarinatus TaxID=27406 RepID=A0AAW0Y2V8_CHEQU